MNLIYDFEFFARLLCNASEVLLTPEATLYYRSGMQSSLSGQKNPQAVESAFHYLFKGTGHLLQRRSDPEPHLSCVNVHQDFIYTLNPQHLDLRAVIQQRIQQFGGGNLDVDGGHRFPQLRRLVGSKAAKRCQKLVSRS